MGPNDWDSMPGLRRQGGQRWHWLDDLVQWTGLTLPELVGWPRIVLLGGDLFMRLPTLLAEYRTLHMKRVNKQILFTLDLLLPSH